MNILVVNFEYTTAGSTLALLDLAEHLRAADHDVSVTAVRPQEAPVKRTYRERGFQIVDELPGQDIDLAICNTIMTAPQLLQMADHSKTLWWIHEGSVGLDQLVNNPGNIAAFQQAGAVVFPVPHLRDAVYRSFIYDQDPGRFVVIPHGVPPAGALRSRPPDGEMWVISVGSVYPRKRHEDLIRAMELLDSPMTRCKIVGPYFSLPDDCLNVIAGNPQRYELTGELDRAATLEMLATADIFCLPSSSEVLPLTTLEAGLLGKPIILADLPVYAGIWRHGHNCLMNPVGAIGMLAQSIAMLSSNVGLRDRLGAAARQTAARYTQAACFARFDALIDTL